MGYTGHKYDTDLGLNYIQARYYDLVIGRFYANDPVDAVGHFGTLNGIHGFNRYVYANNNPYKYVDPTGMCSRKTDSEGDTVCDASGDPAEVVVVTASQSTGKQRCTGCTTSTMGMSFDTHHSAMQQERDAAGGGLTHQPQDWNKGFKPYLSNDQMKLRAYRDALNRDVSVAGSIALSPLLFSKMGLNALALYGNYSTATSVYQAFSDPSAMNTLKAGTNIQREIYTALAKHPAALVINSAVSITVGEIPNE